MQAGSCGLRWTCCQKASSRRDRPLVLSGNASTGPYHRLGAGRRRSSGADAVLAARSLGARDRQRRRPHGCDGLLARLALARPAARRDLRRQAGVLLRAPAPGRRLRGQHARLGQEAIARQFASSLPPIVHWQGVAIREGTLAPLIEGALGWIEARTVAEHDVGDHTFFVGSVVAAEQGPSTSALVYRDREIPRSVIDAVIFDMDGVLIESEEVWDAVREAYVRERGGRYDEEIQRAMMGMSSHRVVALPARDGRARTNRRRRSTPRSCERMLAAYREHLPLVDGRRRRRASGSPRAIRSRVASSSNRPLIDAVLDGRGLAAATSGRPSRRRRSRAESRRPTSTSRPRDGSASTRARAQRSRTRTAASARPRAAGMRVVAIPNPTYPPDADALAQADVVIRVARRAHARAHRFRIAVIPSRTVRSTHSTRSSARTWSLKRAIARE